MDEDAFRRCPLPLGWQDESRDAMSALADEVMSNQRGAFYAAPWPSLWLRLGLAENSIAVGVYACDNGVATLT